MRIGTSSLRSRSAGGGDRHDVQAEVQVLAELALLDLAAQILPGRRDHPQVDLLGLGAADPAQLALLEHPQELGLEIERQLAEFVEEHRAARGQLEGALAS
jgi:hypothetical protein